MLPVDYRLLSHCTVAGYVTGFLSIRLTVSYTCELCQNDFF